jgi:hypothetical protein
MKVRTVTWVVYEKQVPGKPKMTLVCDQSEWDEMELVQPSYNVVVKSGITNEGEAERLARSTSAYGAKEQSKRSA